MPVFLSCQNFVFRAFFRLHWVPVLPSLPDTGMKGQFRFLAKPAPWLIYAGVFFGQASVYCGLSYIAPIMTQVAGFSEDSMTYIMVLVGAGMVSGNFLAGRLADRYSPSLVTAVIATLAIVLMPMAYLFAAFRIPSLLFAFAAPALLFGLASPALVGVPCAVIGAAALYRLYYREKHSWKS